MNKIPQREKVDKKGDSIENQEVGTLVFGEPNKVKNRL